MKRFTILKAMTTVALIMVGLSSVCRTSYVTMAIVETTALLVLIFALVRALVGPKPRAFWIGFALSGWIYFVLHLAPGFESTVGRRGAGAFLADMAYASIGPNSALVAGRGGPKAALASILYLRPSWVWSAWNGWENGFVGNLPFCPTSYLHTIHYLSSLVVASIGGMIAGRLGRDETETRRKE